MEIPLCLEEVRDLIVALQQRVKQLEEKVADHELELIRIERSLPRL